MPTALIHHYVNHLWDTFWTPTFWLPPNITWADFKDSENVVYPKFIDMCYPVAYSVLIMAIRFIIERFVFLPVGLRSGLKPKLHVVQNPLLEEAFLKSPSKDMQQKNVVGLAKKLGWTEYKVQEWSASIQPLTIFDLRCLTPLIGFNFHVYITRMKHRQEQHRPSALVKLTESGWRFTYYSFSVCYGLYVLWDKSWFWNIDESWTNYPHQNVTFDIMLYYTFQLSCYWSMLFSQFIDVRRKDFLEMFIHHLTTILLITFSYSCNLIRGGSLVLIVHDISDVFMEAAKIFKYIKWQLSCDICFGVFFVVWTVTRLFIFPGYLIKNFWLTAPNFMPMFPAFQALKYLLLVLFVLHIMWTYFILKILRRALLSGKTEKDSRSSSSEASGDEENSSRLSSVRQRK